MGKMKPLPKLILFLLLVGGLFFGAKQAMYYGWIPRPDALATLVPLEADLVDAQVIDHNLANIKVLPLPDKTVSTKSNKEIRWLIWAWNSQMGFLYANGGPVTTKGSLIEDSGAKVRLIRQDDVSQMQNELVTFATELSNGNTNPRSGAHFVNIMGDGAPAFLAGVNERLKELGSEYTAEIIGSCGYSRGEDQFMGLPEWKTDPQTARGALVSGVLRDGDWNLAMRWANINGIPNNPDETTFDPDALNWVATDSYIDASQKYISGYCEDRPVKGQRGETKRVCVNGVVTWTPGDVMVAEKKGGLVTLISTKDAIFQMPSTIIGIKKWNQDNAETVIKILDAIAKGSDQVRVNPQAFRRAAEISTTVYKEQTPEYWMKYFKGVTERDVKGLSVQLGGSAVSNLADNLQLFGLSGGPDIYKATYETFGNIAVQQYPTVMPSYPPYSEVVNKQYLSSLASRVDQQRTTTAEEISYSSAPIQNVVGSRNYSITFRLGSAVIDPRSFAVLNEIANDLLTSRLSVEVHGHTDNTGNPAGNMVLSQQRAQSVRDYLLNVGGNAIPDVRVRTFAHGQEEPIADNATESGRAQNRRVQIVLGN